jgi:hypothetical protein
MATAFVSNGALDAQLVYDTCQVFRSLDQPLDADQKLMQIHFFAETRQVRLNLCVLEIHFPVADGWMSCGRISQ